MTEKLLTFPSPTSQELVVGVNRSKFNFFPEQHQHKPTKTFVPGQHARIQEIFVRGTGGGGVQATQLILQFTEGVQWFYYTFSKGGSNFFQGGGGVQMLISIETHITITCDFPEGSGPPIPIWIRKCTMWHFGTNRLRRACAASF